MKHKSDVFDVFKKWLVHVENEQVGSSWSPIMRANTAMEDLKSSP